MTILSWANKKINESAPDDTSRASGRLASPLDTGRQFAGWRSGRDRFLETAVPGNEPAASFSDYFFAFCPLTFAHRAFIAAEILAFAAALSLPLFLRVGLLVPGD